MLIQSVTLTNKDKTYRYYDIIHNPFGYAVVKHGDIIRSQMNRKQSFEFFEHEVNEAKRNDWNVCNTAGKFAEKFL